MTESDQTTQSQGVVLSSKEESTGTTYVVHHSSACSVSIITDHAQQYRLDDNEEQYDVTQPSTSACPLLPGQTVNIMEIPTEVVALPQRIASASAIMTAPSPSEMTLDPADRYRKIHRKHPTKLPRFYRSCEGFGDKVSEYQSSVMESGGPVQPAPSGKQQASHKVLKRIRGYRPQVYQQPSPCLTRSTSAETEALLQSIATTIPELGKLPTLRPFGPTPAYESDTRPSTRHGSTDGAPVGLGISDYHDEPRSQQHSPTFGADSSLVSPAKSDWPLCHPSPLAANPTSTPISPLSNRHSSLLNSSDQAVSPLNEAYPHGGFSPERQGTGLNEMLSPTFTAVTLASDDEQETPADSFALTDYLSQGPSYDYTSAWLASSANSPLSFSVSDYDHASNKRHSSTVTVVLGGQNPSSTTLRASISPLQHEASNNSEATHAEQRRFHFVDHISSSSYSSRSAMPDTGLDRGRMEPSVAGDGDFAREVFGALGVMAS